MIFNDRINNILFWLSVVLMLVFVGCLFTNDGGHDGTQFIVGVSAWVGAYCCAQVIRCRGD